MTEYVIRFICCALFGVASVFDEHERKIPRYLSYLEIVISCAGWLIEFYVNQKFVMTNLMGSIGLFGVLLFFWMRGFIGLGDLYMVVSMFVLLSNGQNTRALIWEENMLLCVAFFSASVRLLIRKLFRKKKAQPGCPFALHLLIGYVTTTIMRI